MSSDDPDERSENEGRVESDALLSRHGRRLARLGSLVGGFAHEIKNPLSTIGLNLRLMEEEVGEPQSARERRLVDRARRLSKEVARLQGILDDFLSYVRAPAPRLRAFALNVLVRELCDLVGPGYESQGIALRVMLAEGMPELEADRDLVHQVLLNLLTNAEQALSGAGTTGEILVGTGYEEAKDGGSHVLFVVDSGPGMSEEQLERCFQPYFSTKRGGTGLGLAVARRFVEDHRGSIGVESKLGTGTRFTVRLPSKAAERGGGA